MRRILQIREELGMGLKVRRSMWISETESGPDSAACWAEETGRRQGQGQGGRSGWDHLEPRRPWWGTGICSGARRATGSFWTGNGMILFSITSACVNIEAKESNCPAPKLSIPTYQQPDNLSKFNFCTLGSNPAQKMRNNAVQFLHSRSWQTFFCKGSVVGWVVAL